MEINVEKEKPLETVTPTPPPAPKEPTPEEIEKAKNEMMEVLGYAKPSDETLKAEREKFAKQPAPPQDAPPQSAGELAAEAQAVADAKAAEEAAAKTAAEKAAKKKKATPPPAEPPAPTAEEIAAEVVRQTKKDEPPAPPAPEVEPLSEVDQHDQEVFQNLETLFPEKKGVAEKHLKFVKEAREYQSKWENENPGEDFDPDAKEHETFYDKNQPAEIDVESKEFKKAERNLEYKKEVEPIVRAKTDEQTKEIKKLQFDHQMEKIQPVIVSAQALAILEFVKAVDPEAAKLITDAEGQLDASTEAFKKLEEYDPFLNTQLHATARTVGMAVEEIRKFTDPKLSALGYKFNPNENAIHKHISQIAMETEETLAKAPEEKRARKFIEPGGVEVTKQFLTARQWNDRLAKADSPAKFKALKNEFWTFTGEDLVELVIGVHAAEVKAKNDEMNAFAEERAKRKGNLAPKPTPEPPPPTPPPPSAKPKPPSTASGSDTLTTAPGIKSGEKSFGESAVAHFYG